MAEHLDDAATDHYLPNPGIVLSGDFEEPHGYRTRRPQGTRDWLLTFTYGGKGKFFTAEGPLECGAGDVVLLPPGVRHDYATPPGEIWRFAWAHFMPEPDWVDLLQLPRRVGDLLHLHIDQEVVRERLLTALRRVVRDSADPDPLQQRLAMNGLEEAALLLGRYTARFERGAMDSRIRQTLDYLNEQFRGAHTIASLADRVALSPSRFAHLFKRETGESVLETLLKLRLRRAVELLERTALPIARVAEEVGFADSFYFTKQFSALYGLSPSAYRKSAGARQEHE